MKSDVIDRGLGTDFGYYSKDAFINAMSVIVLLDKHNKYVDIVDYFWWYETLDTLTTKEHNKLNFKSSEGIALTDVIKYKCSRKYLRKVLKKYYEIHKQRGIKKHSC